MSKEDKESYAQEIKYSQDNLERQNKLVKDLQRIKQNQLDAGVIPSESDLSSKALDKTLVYIGYSDCLRRYEKSGEKFVTAKTACTVESGLNND